MPWIENIRNKSHTEKVRLIWIVLTVVVVLLVILWVFTSKISSNLPKDTTLFQTIGRGFRDIGEQYNKK